MDVQYCVESSQICSCTEIWIMSFCNGIFITDLSKTFELCVYIAHSVQHHWLLTSNCHITDAFTFITQLILQMKQI